MKGNLRFVILKALENKDQSGYGLMKSIGEMVGKKPSPGSMYPLLESLHNDQLIRKKEQGKKDIYSLTAKGKLELKKIGRLKEEFFRNMEKNVKVWCMMSGEDAKEHLQTIQAMRKDKEEPFKEIKKDMESMKREVFRLYKEKKIKKHAKEINHIFNEATKKLKKLQ